MIRQSATYQEIQDWVRAHYRFVPKTCWIAHCKEIHGLPLRGAPMRWVERDMAQAAREDFEGHRSVWWLTIDPETEAQIEKRKTRKRLSQNAKIPHEGDAL